MPDRRETLKIIGAIGTTCAFPYASDELYGQHVHPAPAKQAPAQAPKFFTAGEFRLVSRIADLIIPETDTPGASAAGVPSYIDFVVNSNPEHQLLFRSGLPWLDEHSQQVHGKAFMSLPEADQIALLAPVCQEADEGKSDSLTARFFRAMKGMTADGYYTSKIGMTEELGFRGGAVLAKFPSCEVPEH
jgi:hypothetical protein